MTSYHKTADVPADLHALYEGKAAKQDEIVLSILKNNWPASLSPTQVHDLYTAMGFPDCPVTSIRRAMSNLTKENLIYKTEATVQGQYGRAEHTWKFINNIIPRQGVQMKLL
jgi:hypothetical protein